MRTRIFFLHFAGVAALVAACGDEPTRPLVTESPGRPAIGAGGASGSGGALDAGADASDAGECTSLPLTGGTIPQQTATGEVPVGTGGSIANGTYDITEAVIYGGAAALPGPSGASYQGSIRITDQTFERHVLFKSAGGAVVESSSKGTLNVKDASGVIALTCPYATQEQVTYTVSGNSLVISNIVTRESFGFTKRL